LGRSTGGVGVRRRRFSLIVILLWIYYSAQVVFFARSFTKVLLETFRSVVGGPTKRVVLDHGSH
jgi:uncharacterized BrkB/YihY/UPF0761 family membrane protein